MHKSNITNITIISDLSRPISNSALLKRSCSPIAFSCKRNARSSAVIALAKATSASNLVDSARLVSPCEKFVHDRLAHEINNSRLNKSFYLGTNFKRDSLASDSSLSFGKFKGTLVF